MAPNAAALRPQDFFGKLSHGLRVGRAGGQAGMGEPRSSQPGVAVSLESDVHSLQVAGSYEAGAKEKTRHVVSEDVQKQLHRLGHLIETCTADSDIPRERSTRTVSTPRCPHTELREEIEKFLSADLPMQLLQQIPALDFEARTAAINVFGLLLRPGLPTELDTKVLAYVRHHPHLYDALFAGCVDEEIAVHCWVMLRSCTRRAETAQMIFQARHIFRLMELVQSRSFEISSEAFGALREVLVDHKVQAAEWLEANFMEFFKEYDMLLTEGEYVTQRRALKLLSEILLDRAFMKVMVMYVSSDKHLKVHMNLLRDESRTIRQEAFHVFKLFAANPSKPCRVKQILFKNKRGLIELLEGLEAMKGCDPESFRKDRTNVVGKLQALEDPTASVSHAKGQAPDASKILMRKLSINSTNTESTTASSQTSLTTLGHQSHHGPVESLKVSL